MSIDFKQWETELSENGCEALLNRLVDELREKEMFGELFEALKMRVRGQIGLPLLYAESGEELDDTQSAALEAGLLDACRDVGQSLVRSGRLRDGWMYLRPVGDKAMARKVFGEVEPDEDNMEEMIEVCLHEGLDVARGFALMLEQYGTCNAITTFESGVRGLPPADQAAAAQLLVQHVHDELSSTLKSDIAQQEGSEPSESTIAELSADRDWLFGEHSYHIDTTHLASTVRFARLCADPATLRLALDLTHYGRRLNEQFQYQGEEPFLDQYPSHALYFQALLGENQEQALQYFLDKAQALDAAEWSTIAIDTYVDLLAKLGRHREAMDAVIELTPAGARPAGQAPSLLELAESAGDYTQFLDYCRKNEDLLGFATGLLLKQA